MILRKFVLFLKLCVNIFIIYVYKIIFIGFFLVVFDILMLILKMLYIFYDLKKLIVFVILCIVKLFEIFRNLVFF